MFKIQTQHQPSTGLKRACPDFEMESPFPESFKKTRYSTQNNINNTIDISGRPLSPVSSLDEENKLYQLKQQLMEQQWRYQMNGGNNMNNNIDGMSGGSNSSTMTPISTPPNQLEYSKETSNAEDSNNVEPYCEIEDYMARGYEDIQYSSNASQLNNPLQYGLYDLTQEELDMMIMDDATLTNINTVY